MPVTAPSPARAPGRALAAFACALLAALGGQALAQGQDSASSSSAPGGSQAGVVEIGAGATTAAVTTGSSGPRPAGGGASKPEPLPLSFSLTPPQRPFLGPGMLPIAANPAKRCELIGHAAARQRCESPNPATTGAAR